MNTTQLRKLGVPDECIGAAIEGIQQAVQAEDLRGREIKQLIGKVLASPSDYAAHSHFGR